MDKNRIIAQGIAVLDLAIFYYGWEIENWLDAQCALYNYHEKIAPMDRLVELVEIGKINPNSILNLKTMNQTL